MTDKLGYAGATLHGAGRLVVAWSEAFDPSRVKIVACALRDPGRLYEGFERAGVPITFLGVRRYDPSAILRLIRLIRAHQIDVLHLQEFGASTFGRIAGLLTRRPTIVHVHAEYGDSAVGGYPLLVRAVDHLLSALTTRVVAVSHSVADYCVGQMGFRRSQVVVIHNPLTREMPPADETSLAPLRRLYGLPPDAVVVGTVTRFHPVKGTTFLLEAFARVLHAVPNSYLLIVGDGPERAALEAQARSLGIERRAVFAGFRDDIEEHLRLFRVAVIPSLHEGLPLAGVEALSAGVPLVASRVGGLPELVSEGRTGFLVEPGNATAIADAVIRILQDPELERSLRAHCLTEARQFSMSTFVTRMEETYRATVEAGA
ncbi:MAG: glycosyltransferase [Gemmatimonadales bacterium]